MLAAVVANSRDYELDIILISAKDGQVIRNLTKGFDYTHRIEYIATAGGLRGNLMPWIAWAPVGDTIAYFARTGKVKSLLLQNVATGNIEKRIELETVDGPESPSFSPDGKQVVFAAIQNGITDIYTVDLATAAVTNLTQGPDRRLLAGVFARWPVDRLFGPREQQRQTVPAGSGHGPEEAADVRHARRHGGEVLQRHDARVHVDGGRSEGAARARGRRGTATSPTSGRWT